MRTMLLIAASIMLAAAPASANVAAPVANDATTSDANVVTDMNVATTVPDMNALEPAPTPANSEAASQTVDNDDRGGFPWGLLGLIGLIGLLGRRHASS